MFCYHGAEHKTIFCYEAGLPLTVENVRIQPRHHPRCGTSFLFVVIIVSILCLQPGVPLHQLAERVGPCGCEAAAAGARGGHYL